MGGDDYVITSNSKHTDAHKAAHDLDEQVTRLRGVLLWLLWHHQGGSSSVGQPIRKALGIGPHDHMTTEQVAEAQRAGGKLKTPNAEPT